jgi:hypothetical protein
MDVPRRCSACGPTPQLGDAAPLVSVRPELEAIERLSREIGDLSAVLRTRLSSEQFRLVWQLRDAVERLGLAEELMREQRLVDSLARHLPTCSDAIHATREHIRAIDAAVEELV